MSEARVEAAARAICAVDDYGVCRHHGTRRGETDTFCALGRARAAEALAAADAADRARGVVRVDTRDEALGRRIKGVAQWWVNGRLPVAPQFWDGFGGDVLAALAPEAKS